MHTAYMQFDRAIAARDRARAGLHVTGPVQPAHAQQIKARQQLQQI